jgi:hypothetical protein
MLTKNREKIKNLKLQLSVINYIDIKHMIDYSKKKPKKNFILLNHIPSGFKIYTKINKSERARNNFLIVQNYILE